MKFGHLVMVDTRCRPETPCRLRRNHSSDQIARRRMCLELEIAYSGVAKGCKRLGGALELQHVPGFSSERVMIALTMDPW